MAGELVFLAIVGLAVGSFLSLVADRYDTAESILLGRSHCDNCNEPLRPWELIPLLSYIILRGQCARCHKEISKLYPIFEVITALAFVVIGLAHVSLTILVVELIFVSLLLLLAFYDWMTQSFPTLLLLKGVGISVIIAVLRIWYVPHWGSLTVLDPFFGWLSSSATLWWGLVLSVLVGSGFLALLSFPSRGTWMGYGDVLIGLILGLWLGYPLVLVALVIAFYAGAIVGIIQLLIYRKKKDHRLAFGPFLIYGGIVAHTYGLPLLRWLLKLWGVTV